MSKPLLIIVIGTRPEIIKTYPLLKPLKAFYRIKIIFTGQHFLTIMSDQIFNDLKFPYPDYNLKIKSFVHALQISEMINSISKIIIKENPKVVLVQGDTNSTLAGALAATKLKKKLVHIEAGARCFNKDEPEEVNRILVDHMADINFSFSKYSHFNLKKENVASSIYNFPNTIYETCSLIRGKLKGKKILAQENLIEKGYALVTVHRKSNLNKVSLLNLFELLDSLSKDIKVVFLVHPKTKILIGQLNIKISKNVKLLSPINYKDFLLLMKNSSYIISDSGGVVDESSFFQIPLFIYRAETERQDAIDNSSALILNPNLTVKSKLQKIKTFIKFHSKKSVTSKNINYNFCKDIARIIHKETNENS